MAVYVMDPRHRLEHTAGALEAINRCPILVEPVKNFRMQSDTPAQAGHSSAPPVFLTAASLRTTQGAEASRSVVSTSLPGEFATNGMDVHNDVLFNGGNIDLMGVSV